MFAFSGQITSAAKSLPICTFMKEIRLVVTEKRGFVSGDESKLKRQIRNFEFYFRTITLLLSRFKEQEKQIIHLNLRQKY